MVVDAWWFALLFAVPSILDPTPVEFGMRSLAFSGYYWLACCVFVGAALAPRVAAHIGGRAFAGRRGRFVRAACIALASMWFCASSVLAISARCLGAVDAYAIAASLHGIWKVTSIGSMVACAVHMYLRAAMINRWMPQPRFACRSTDVFGVYWFFARPRVLCAYARRRAHGLYARNGVTSVCTHHVRSAWYYRSLFAALVQSRRRARAARLRVGAVRGRDRGSYVYQVFARPIFLVY